MGRENSITLERRDRVDSNGRIVDTRTGETNKGREKGVREEIHVRAGKTNDHLRGYMKT